MISTLKIAIIFSKSLLFIMDILRSDDPNVYHQIKENLESQEASILKTNSEMSKDLNLFENEAVKYENEKVYEESVPIKSFLKESDFIKLEKYEILKKLNENLKLEIAYIKETAENQENIDNKRNFHNKKDSLKSQLEECVNIFSKIYINFTC